VRDSLPIDMLLSALSFLVAAQSSSEVPEGLMNNPVLSNSKLFKNEMSRISEPMGEKLTRQWTKISNQYSDVNSAH